MKGIRNHRRVIGASLALALVAFVGPSSAHAKKGRGKARPLPRSAVSPISLVAQGNDRLHVAGLFPVLDQLRLTSAPDGLLVVNRLPLERYVLGLNEVPPEWPLEALKAQAVAARTYALWNLLKPPVGSAANYGFDICATIECQVFTGAHVLSLADGHRWIQAVRATRGEAVLYGGAPILARYHSTSGGRTFNNEDVFFGEPAYPYLKSVLSPTEQASPLYRWEVRFSLANLQAILERAGWWGPAKGRLVSARTVGRHPGLPYPDIRFKGTKGTIIRFGDDFRTIARSLAPALFPGVYPSSAPTPSGRLPETLPSERFKTVTIGKVVHFFGRGWGHGAGMSQWGAHGMAVLGEGYVDILRHYYSRTVAGPFPYAGSIDVGLAWARSSVTVTGPFKLVDGAGRTLVANALGTWQFNFTTGNSIGIVPGEVAPSRPHRRPTDGRISVAILKAPKTVSVGDAAKLTFRLSRDARVATVTSGASEFSDLSVQLSKKGTGRITWVAPMKPGRYRVRVEATAERATGLSKPVGIRVRRHEVRERAPTTPRSLEEIEATASSAPLVVSALVLLLTVGTAVAAGTIAWWPRQQP